MKNLLENVIRTALFEAPTTKAKLRSMDAADFQVAKRAGAVFAYYAIVKGVKDETALLNAVAGATLGSQDSDTRVGVGASGPYSNGKFIYVVNTDDIDRKNVAAVWIMPALPKPVNKDSGIPKSDIQTEPEVIVPFSGLRIGRSEMISNKSYMKRAELALKNDGSIKVVDVSQMPANKTGLEKAIDKLPSRDKEEPAAVTTTATTATSTANTATQSITYPHNVDGSKVYTMSDTDPYVYTKIGNTWKYTDKKAFEATPMLKLFDRNLPPQGITNIEKKIGKQSATSTDTTPSTTTTTTTTNKPAINTVSSTSDSTATNGVTTNTNTTTTSDVTTGSKTLKQGAALTWAAGAGSRVPYFFYNTTTKKFTKQPGSWTIGKTNAKYQTTSKDGKYYYVEHDGDKIWIEKKYFK